MQKGEAEICPPPPSAPPDLARGGQLAWDYKQSPRYPVLQAAGERIWFSSHPPRKECGELMKSPPRNSVFGLRVGVCRKLLSYAVLLNIAATSSLQLL